MNARGQGTHPTSVRTAPSASSSTPVATPPQRQERRVTGTWAIVGVPAWLRLPGSRNPVLDDERGAGGHRGAFALDVPEHAIVGLPAVGRALAADIAALVVVEADVRVPGDHGLAVGIAVRAVPARGDRGADEFGAQDRRPPGRRSRL